MRIPGNRLCGKEQDRGFTLVELLVVIVVIAIIAGILLPTLARSKERAQAIFCLKNTRELTVAWIMYADEHNGALAYNLAAPAKAAAVASAIPSFLNNSPKMTMNWADNVLSWGLDPDNTNAAKMVQSGLGPYLSREALVYHCPSDHALSDLQRNAGWQGRVRSYSMNAMIGNAGPLTRYNSNPNNPDYIQFLNMGSISQPANVFVFLDEHPDSIRDGYFMNRAYSLEWLALPGSYHDGGACLSFADGHSEVHHWHSSTTTPPPVPFAANLPRKIPTSAQAAASQLADFYWVISHMSVERDQDRSPLPGDNPGSQAP